MSDLNVQALRCEHCGGSLELPEDVRLLHIDCPFCGQDNVLPRHLVEARERRYESELALEGERQRLEVHSAAAKHNRRLGWIGITLGLAVPIISTGTCSYVQSQNAARTEQAERNAALARLDPKQNGQAAVLAQLERLRSEEGCERILLQPTVRDSSVAPVSLQMVAFDRCAYVLGSGGHGAPLSMTYAGNVALGTALPLPSASIKYRLCASEDAQYSFALTSEGAPFTVAAIECPRQPSEGASRATPNDPVTTGKQRVLEMQKALLGARCRAIPSAPPTVFTGRQTFTLTAPENAPCFNLLIAGHYADAPLSVHLEDPSGHSLPVPEPGSELRVEYCAPSAGDYKVSIRPSSADPYSITSVDCARNGPEGLARLTSGR